MLGACIDLESPHAIGLQTVLGQHAHDRLLDNAVRYGPAGQEVRVALTSGDESTVVLSVEDQGPGVPAGQRAEIWNKFVRLERDRGTQRAGTGIGLAVVRDLVELHGGRAWVEEGARGGAKFFVRLPCGARPT